MKKEERKKLYKLLKIWTRAQIISRHGALNGPHQAAFQEKLNMEDAILKLMFGSSDLVELGIKWKLLDKSEKKKKKIRDKNEKEILDFFGGESTKKKRKRKRK